METNIQTYVIHCDKHKERLLNIEKHLKIVIPDLKLWKGIIPHYSDIHENTEYESIEKLFKNYDDNITLDKNYNFLTLGEIGCYLSHLSLIKYLIGTSIKYTIILEDDTALLPLFEEKVTEILDNFENFDMLYLGVSSKVSGQRLCNQSYVYDFSETPIINGTFAYVLNNSKLEKIYSALLQVKDPIDVTYTNFINNGKITAYVVRPFLANYDRTTFYSTVQNNIVKKILTNKARKTRKLLFKDRVIKSMNIIINNWLTQDSRLIKDSTRFTRFTRSTQFTRSTRSTRSTQFTRFKDHDKKKHNEKQKNEIKQRNKKIILKTGKNEKIKQPTHLKLTRKNNARSPYVKKVNR